MKKVGKAETWSWGERDCGCYRGERAIVTEKSKRKKNPQGMNMENISPKPLAWEMRGVNFMSSCNQPSLKPRVLKVSRLDWDEARGHCTAPGEKAGKQPGGQTVWKK